jgi:hypothetical protein
MALHLVVLIIDVVHELVASDFDLLHLILCGLGFVLPILSRGAGGGELPLKPQSLLLHCGELLLRRGLFDIAHSGILQGSRMLIFKKTKITVNTQKGKLKHKQKEEWQWEVELTCCCH